MRQKYPNAEEKGVIRETLPTQKNGTEGSVVGALVVDGEGKVLDLEFQQQQSVSSDLKDAARDYFKENPLE